MSLKNEYNSDIKHAENIVAIITSTKTGKKKVYKSRDKKNLFLRFLKFLQNFNKSEGV